MESSFRNLWYEKEMRSVESKEAGEFFHINGGYWKTPNLNSIRIGTFYYSPPFECVRNIWQLSLFSLGFDADLDLHFEIRLSHLRGIFNAEKVRIGIAGDEGEFLTCDEFCRPFEFPLFHVIRLIFPSVSDRGYEEGLRIFMKINSRDHLEAEERSFNQSKVRIGRRKSSQKNQICFEVSTQTEDDIAGNEKYNVKNKAACLDTSVENKNESGNKKLQESLKKNLNISTNESILTEEMQSPRYIKTICHRVLKNIMHETTKKNMKGLVRPDIRVSTFIDFLYIRDIGSTSRIQKNAIELYKATHVFSEFKIKALCRNHILQNLTAENFCDALNLTLSPPGDTDIKKSCDLFFTENALDIALTSKWKNFSKKNRELSKEMHLRRLHAISFHEKYIV